MVLPAKKQKPGLNTENKGVKPANTVIDAQWVKVTKGTARTTMTFNPTIVHMPPAIKAAENSLNQSLMNENGDSIESVEMVRPFLKGIEDDSVLIDVTGLPDSNLLRTAMQSFNKDAHLYKGYNDYIGRVPKTRKYMNREILETCWMKDSPGHQAILKGFKLKDGTFIKGFPSLPADDTIVNIRFDRLPMEPVPVLKSIMKDRLSHFGEVLDYGISYTQGDYVGQGYATLNTTPRTDEEPYETLDRIIYMTLDSGKNRQILLQWQDMPDFCRICQKGDHCRADCPDYKKYIQCHNCNGHGHISRNCDRQNAIDTPSKKQTFGNKKERKQPYNTKSTLSSPPIGPRQANKKQETSDTAHQDSAKDVIMQESIIITDTDKETEEAFQEQQIQATGAQTLYNSNTDKQTILAAADQQVQILEHAAPLDTGNLDTPMKENTNMERPSPEDNQINKKIPKRDEKEDVTSTRSTRNSSASKYNQQKGKQKDDTLDDTDVQGQATYETAPSNKQNLN
jgi:hypothetical protein